MTYLLVGLLLLASCVCVSGASQQNSTCCHISYKAPHILGCFTEYEAIYFLATNSCSNYNVVRLKINDTSEVCGNGFNVMGFMTSVLQNLSVRSEQETELLQILLSLRKEFVDTFDIAKTNTSIFSVVD
ncbi:glycoprotein L [Phascolarctid gammaherpesvirus 1]|uniref:Glycoprotein L n=1 Tax=Phascolarctid gammaherpesvirus 1 TaxID=2249313 RepID=A0A3S5HA18_9GAMA|nr:glycoprotein L [Phascolarctid gammaherpesvirus 1]AZB49217.1 glycoprotein L [Phascolarctid gammaherpesvirus 1]